MWNKVKNHFLVSLVFFLLTLLQQYSFYWLKGLSITFFSPEKYLIYFMFFLLISFSSGSKVRLFLFNLFLVLNFFVMAHLSYFGTLSTEYHHILIPFLFTVFPVLLGGIIYKKVPLGFSHKIITYLILIYFSYNPLRTYFTGNNWGRQPTIKELDGMNMYLSMSYFLGRILPGKMMKKDIVVENESTRLKLISKETSNWDNIIVVLGESLSPNHLSYFGHHRRTTPFLETLRNNPQFYGLKGLSSGVSSDISIAFFFNLTYGEPGAFKMA